MDPNWQEDIRLQEELALCVSQGSRHLDDSLNQEDRSVIIRAREQFMDFVGLPEETLDKFRISNPTIIPLDTFIYAQRTMYTLGLNASKVINTNPNTLGYSAENIQEKYANLQSLGVDASKVINTNPTTLNLSTESVQEKYTNLQSLGLDASKVINTNPNTLNHSTENIQEKYTNLQSLGLDASKVINTNPSTLGCSTESVQKKMQLLERGSKLLKWQYPAQALVETFPAILGFSTDKLKVLIQIAAEHLSTSARSVEPKYLRSALIEPLEKYIIVLSTESDSDEWEFSELVRSAKKQKLSAEARKARALELAPQLGRIGTMYLRYRGQ